MSTFNQHLSAGLVHGLPVDLREEQAAEPRNESSAFQRVMGLEFSQETLGFWGKGVAMDRLRTQLRRIGPHFRMVLLTGETGTGKELAARALHRLTSHPERPLVVCDASWGDAERVLARRGGAPAVERVDDLLASAHGGTVFLDQVEDMPMSAQVTLLQGLERWERAARTSGKGERMAARIIASSSRDLRAMMKAGLFREELYYRIATVEVMLPALREHRESVLGLSEIFVQREARELGRTVRGISPLAMERMLRYEWPGNVRELQNVMRSAVIESGGELIEVEHLSLRETEANEPGTLPFKGTGARLQDMVERHVHQVLRACAGNKVRAAELLGISRSTLYRMLEGSSDGAAGGVKA